MSSTWQKLKFWNALTDCLMIIDNCSFRNSKSTSNLITTSEFLQLKIQPVIQVEKPYPEPSETGLSAFPSQTSTLTTPWPFLKPEVLYSETAKNCRFL